MEPIEIPCDDGTTLLSHPQVADDPRVTAFVLPALGVAARHYALFARELATHGLSVHVLEPRSYERRTPEGPKRVDHGYSRRVADAAVAIRALGTPGRPNVVIGHSLGGHVASLLAAREAALVDALAFVAAGTPYAPCFPRSMRVKMGIVRAVASLAPYLGYFPGRAIGFGDREAPTLMREWSLLAAEGRFVVDGVDVASELEQVEARALAVELEGDSMAPPLATADLLRRLPRLRLRRVGLAPPELPGEACDHVRWVKHPAKIAETIARFVLEPAAGSTAAAA